jgi:hypothetical protein
MVVKMFHCVGRLLTLAANIRLLLSQTNALAYFVPPSVKEQKGLEPQRPI